MADLARPPGVAAQVCLIAGLRWRMLRNGLRRQDARFDLIGLIVAGLLAALLVVALSFAFGAGAYAFLARGHVARLGLLFWAIFLFWQLIPIFLAGFGQRFEFRSLLRFPLNLGAFFLVSLGYGLADFAAVASLCWLLAMTIGGAAARPDLLPPMIGISGIFLLGNVLLERLLSSWLERLLARRRTRELLFGLLLLFLVGGQLLASSLEEYVISSAHRLSIVLTIFATFPAGLAGRAMAAAAAHHFGGALLYAAGLAGYALLFGAVFWFRLAAQYRGEELSESASPPRAPLAAPASPWPVTSQGLRWLSPPVEAVVRKEFRYFTRNTFMLLNLLLPLLLVLLFSSQLGVGPRQHPGTTPRNMSIDQFFPGMLAYLILILTAPAYNCFAYEGRGIQTYFTAPVRHRDIFAGKNLLLLATLSLELTLCIALLAVRTGLPSPPMFAATLAAIVFSVIGQLIVANWSSLNFPRKIEFGSLRNQRASGMAVLLAFGTQIALAGACAAVFLAGRWLENPWLPAGIFAVLAAAAIGGYFASLDALSGLAERKREVLIAVLCR